MASAATSQGGLLRAAVYLITGVFIFSTEDVIVKWISGEYPVHEIVLIRSISGVFPLVALAYFKGGIGSLRTRRLGTHALRSFVMFATYTAFYLSLAALRLAESVTLFFAAPLFITILSAFWLDERVDVRCWISVVVGFLGVILMLRPDVSAFNPAGLLAILSAFCYALGSILTRKLGQTESGVTLAFYPTVMYIAFAGFLGVVFNVVSFESSSHPSVAFLFREWRFPARADFLWMVLLGLMTAVGFLCLSQAYRSSHPAVIAPLEYVAVPFSAALGYIIWKEVLDAQAVLAVVIIIGSGLYILGRETLLGIRSLLNRFRTKPGR